MSIRDDKETPDQPTEQAWTEANFADTLDLLTISLARPGLFNFLGDTVAIVTQEANQPASINREHQETLRQYGSH